MEVKRFKSLSASAGGIWGGWSVGRVITLPMATPSEAETEHIRTTHAPSVLMTPKVLCKLLDSQGAKKWKLCTLEAPISPVESILV